MGPLSSASRIARGLALALVLTACAGLPPWFPQGASLARWKREAQELRGLEFVRPFHVRFVARDDVREIVAAILDSSYEQGDIEAYRDGYAALGALPADLDLREALLDLQEDQLLGLYEPDSETMYVVKGGLNEAYGEATIVHELVHALQHQHFPELFRVQQGLRRNDDVVSALGAALEGDASFTMLARMPSGERSVEIADRLREAMLLDQRHPEGKLAEVPRLMRVSLLFGYTHGTVIAAHRYEASGNAGLDELLADPPISTRQAVEPEDDPEVEFVALPLESLRAAVEARGCRVGLENVAGALTVGVLFQDHEGAEREPGLEELLRDWRGDRFVHVVCGSSWELAWVTRWRSEAAADAFAMRYRGIAASIASSAPLSGAAQAIDRGRTVLVRTPGLAPDDDLLLAGSEVRAYRTLGEWMADDCFTESPCPRSGSLAAASHAPSW